MNDVDFSYSRGANFLSAPEPITCDPVPYLDMVPGDKVTNLGTKKRSSFGVKSGLYIQYCGMYTLRGIKHLVFMPTGETVFWMDKYWYYAFAVVETATNRLYVQTSKIGGMDIEVDQIGYFENEII